MALLERQKSRCPKNPPYWRFNSSRRRFLRTLAIFPIIILFPSSCSEQKPIYPQGNKGFIFNNWFYEERFFEGFEIKKVTPYEPVVLISEDGLRFSIESYVSSDLFQTEVIASEGIQEIPCWPEGKWPRQNPPHSCNQWAKDSSNASIRVILEEDKLYLRQPTRIMTVAWRQDEWTLDENQP